MEAQLNTTQADVDRYRQNYLVEMDGIALYRSMASAEKDEKRAAVLKNSRRTKNAMPSGGRGSFNRRGPWCLHIALLRVSVRWLGSRGSLVRAECFPIISSLEARDEAGYMAQPEAAGLPAEERSHSRTLWAMEGGLRPARSDYRHRALALYVARWQLTRRRVRHQRWFGVNFSLVMGFAGAEAKPEYVLLAAWRELLAGSFRWPRGSMSRCGRNGELFEQQIAMEQQELEMSPKEGGRGALFDLPGQGIPEREAAMLARRIIENPKTAIDTLAREELGLDPSQLGSPWSAAASSFAAFIVGALVPVLPYLFVAGQLAWIASALFSCLALFGSALCFRSLPLTVRC